MYEIRELPIASVLADEPARLPLNVLLMLPASPPWRDTEKPLFNLLGAVNQLLGDEPESERVMSARFWAPEWDAPRLWSFVDSSLPKPLRPFTPSEIDRLRVPALPGLLQPETEENPIQPYSIVHCVDLEIYYGYVPNFWLGPLLRIGKPGQSTAVGALRDWLISSGTRLLILQTGDSPEYLGQSERRLAELIVGAGGPAVLIVSGTDQQKLANYFMDVYAGILHNEPLRKITEPSTDDIQVLLTHGSGSREGIGGDELLRFNRWMAELDQRFKLYGETMSEYLYNVRTLAPRLHKTQRTSLTPLAHKFENLSRTISANQQELEQLRNLDWTHEYEGVLPLSRVAASYDSVVEGAGTIGGEGFHLLDYDPLLSEAHTAAYNAPRVLNAGFANPLTGSVYEETEPLYADTKYDLLVDVGPRWDKITSLVQGNADFPEEALKMEAGGYEIEVVFVSQDFLVQGSNGDYSPGLASQSMFVPARTGRSIPIEPGKDRKNDPGPVVFKVLTPSSKGWQQARGRLCLYYQNNLIQSAFVNMTTIRLGETIYSHRVTNEIVVDFRLTGTFQDVESFKRREMIGNPAAEREWAAKAFEPVYELSGAEQVQTEYQVGLNITLNDDYSGKQRILVKDLSEVPPAWKSYDVSTMTTMLGDARTQLENCFWQKDAQCNVYEQKQDGLNPKLGKSLDQFKCDIFKLAILGQDLFNTMFQELQGTGLEKAQWTHKLSKALADRTVIQVARTGEAKYVFPWALVYDIPLPDWKKLRYCEVLNKEWQDGERTTPPKTHCPEHDANATNILCPYGFWGLKHYIEQPIPPLTSVNGNYQLPQNVPNTINVGKDIEVAVGVTRDAKLSLKDIDKHLTDLQGILDVKGFVPPGGADTWPAVCDMLKSPDVVYFLCHGESDGKNAYLGIGLRDQDVDHRVYPTNLIAWSRGQSLDFWQTWEQNHPLVFINGCHTFDLKPGDMLNFVSTFADFGASGVIGTEISIRLPVAIEVAQMLFEGLAKTNMKICEVMYQVRWKLASKGSLLGLAYTPYCMADLHIVKS